MYGQKTRFVLIDCKEIGNRLFLYVGALRRVRSHAERRSHLRVDESQEAGSAATGHSGGGQPLRRDSGGRRDLRQVRRRADGDRPQGPGRRHGALRLEGVRPPGGHRRPRLDGEGDEEGQHRGKRPTAGLRAHRLQGGPGISEGDGLRGQLCLGQQELHDVPHPASFCKGTECGSASGIFYFFTNA